MFIGLIIFVIVDFQNTKTLNLAVTILLHLKIHRLFGNLKRLLLYYLRLESPYFSSWSSGIKYKTEHLPYPWFECHSMRKTKVSDWPVFLKISRPYRFNVSIIILTLPCVCDISRVLWELDFLTSTILSNLLSFKSFSQRDCQTNETVHLEL